MKYTLIIDKSSEEEVTVRAHAPSALTEKIESLVSEFSESDCIIGYTNDEMRKLSFSEIECITVIDRKVIAIDTEGCHYRITVRLRDLEDILPPYFMRINKSTIANERRILKFKAALVGGVDAIFRCGYRDYVSRRCLSEIKRRYERI